MGAAHTGRPLSCAQHRSPPLRSRNKFRSLFSSLFPTPSPWVKLLRENETRLRHPVAAREPGPLRRPRVQPARHQSPAVRDRLPPSGGGGGRAEGAALPRVPRGGWGKRGRLSPAASGKIVPRKKKKKPLVGGSAPPPPPSPSPPQLSPTRRAGK